MTLTRPADRGSSTENGGATGTDPEELFAAGYAACFDSALAVATADTLCPYSNAVRGNIPVEIRLS